MTTSNKVAKDQQIDIDLELQVATQTYKVLHNTLFKNYEDLRKEQQKFPSRFVAKNEDYENHLLKAAELKHKSIELFRDASATSDALRADFDHLEAHMKIYGAKDFLEQMGFDKITESMRDNYVKLSPDILDLIKVKAELDALFEASERLVKAFEGDETNCRRLLERQNKLTGLL
jgi:hypothetical protein